MKKVTSICLAFFMVLTFFMSTAFAAPEFDGKINSKIVYMLMDADSGKELQSQNKDVKIEPASTTKILTCLLAAENSSMSDVVTVSAKAANTGGSFLGIKKGEKIIMKDLLIGMMLKSGNDATIAVAEHVSGSVGEFVKMMNAKAQEIGMTSSNFTNPNGLHDDDLYTTVLDMAKLAQYALKNPVFMDIVGTVEHKMPKTNKQKERVVKNTNLLLDRESKYFYEGATGMKTGRTTAAGGCLVASATKNGMNLICVIYNDQTSDRTDRWPAAESLFNYGFENYQTVDLASLLKDAPPIKTQLEGYSLDDPNDGLLEFKRPDAGSSIYVTLEKSEAQALKGEGAIEAVPVFNNETLKAPIEEGDILGTVEYKNKATGEIIFSDNLIASRDVLEEGATGGIAVATLPPKTSDEVKEAEQGGAIWFLLIIPAALIVFLVIRMTTTSRSKRFKKRRRPHYSYRIK